MASIDTNKSYKNVCKYCGLVKRSLVQGNFVCGKCKRFCKQSLSEEELKLRNREIVRMIMCALYTHCTQSQRIFMNKILESKQLVSNEQYLSICRILKKEIK